MSVKSVTEPPPEVFHHGVIDRTSGERGADVTEVTFESFFEAEHKQLFRSLFLITGDRQEAEDVAQEAMVRILERWDRVSSMQEPRAYLYRTALNLNRNRHRWTARRWALTMNDRAIQPDASDLVVDRIDVQRALDGLTTEQRAALVLVDYLGFDSRAAGTVIGVDADAVRARVHRGRTTLRERLTEHG